MLILGNYNFCFVLFDLFDIIRNEKCFCHRIATMVLLFKLIVSLILKKFVQKIVKILL